MARTSSSATTDHDEIRRWAEERDGKPSHVRSTGGGEDVGILRIDFPGYSGADSLEEISWDQWFEKFDERGLALILQETTAGGQKSNFNKLVSRETANSGGRAKRGRSSTPRKSASQKSSSSSRGRKARTSSSRSRSGSGSRTSGNKSAAKKSSGNSRRSSSSKTKSAKSSSSRSGGASSSQTRARGSVAKKRSAKSAGGRSDSARGRSSGRGRAA